MGQGSSEAHLRLTGRKWQTVHHEHALFVGESDLFKLYPSLSCLLQGNYFIHSFQETGGLTGSKTIFPEKATLSPEQKKKFILRQLPRGQDRVCLQSLLKGRRPPQHTAPAPWLVPPCHWWKALVGGVRRSPCRALGLPVRMRQPWRSPRAGAAPPPSRPPGCGAPACDRAPGSGRAPAQPAGRGRRL